MGLHVHWEDEQKIIIRQVYDLTWTWDEYLAAFAKTRQLASEVDYPIGLIGEVGLIRTVPPNAILHGARAIRSLPSNIVLAVMVSSSPLALSLLKVILTATQYKHVQATASVEAAKQIIADKRNTELAQVVA